MATRPSRARQAMGMQQDRPDSPAVPSGEVDLIENRIARTRRMESRFADAMQRGMDPTALIADAITAIRTVPELAECEESTFMGALFTAAQLGLRPNVATVGHGWVLPFYSTKRRRKEAQWILGYQGMVELGYRSGLVTEIEAHTIYSNEPHEVELGTGKHLMHKPVFSHADRGEPLLHYAMVTMNTGGKLWHVMGEDDIDEIVKRSQTGSRGYGPWTDDRPAMSRKSCLRQLWRFMPKSREMALALNFDEQVRDIAEPDAAVPMGETITVTRTAAAAPAEPAAPVAEEPSTGRVKQVESRTRTAALDSLERQFGERWQLAVLLTLGGEAVEIDYVTVDELKAAMAFDMNAYDEAQLDAAAEADGK